MQNKLVSIAFCGIVLLSATVAEAREENFNSTADGNAAGAAQVNANCNAAIQLGPCEGINTQTPVSDVTNQIVGNNRGGGNGGSNGRLWETGKDAFPGSETAADQTVAWMSGRTNAVFSAPSPAVGIGAAFLVALFG